MVSPEVFTITPNRNLNTPKVIFVTLGILFLNDNVTWTKCQIRAENRPKLKGKIWRRAENFVPLHCQ